MPRTEFVSMKKHPTPHDILLLWYEWINNNIKLKMFVIWKAKMCYSPQEKNDQSFDFFS